MKKISEGKYKIEYCGLVQYENMEEEAEFLVIPIIMNNGVRSKSATGFYMSVALSVLGIEREINEDGLTADEVEKAKEAILMEL